MAAPTPSVRLLGNGFETVTYMVTIPAGGDADVGATKIADASDLSATTLEIRRVWWSLSGFAVQLLFDAGTDDPGITMAPGTGQLDFDLLANGLTNPQSSGFTGDINMTTTGIAAADDENDDNQGFFIMELWKK